MLACGQAFMAARDIRTRGSPRLAGLPFDNNAKKESTMNELFYPRERTLGTITLVLGILVWLGLIIGTVGTVLPALLGGLSKFLGGQFVVLFTDGLTAEEPRSVQLWCRLLKFRGKSEGLCRSGGVALRDARIADHPPVQRQQATFTSSEADGFLREGDCLRILA